MSTNWMPMPLKASLDLLDYRSASELAVALRRFYVAGPYIFCPDGSHQLRKGWAIREGIAICDNSLPWSEGRLETGPAQAPA